MNKSGSTSDMKNLLSIITVTKNSTSYLHDLIIDLNNQDDLEFIWIVVDGGSDDGTSDLISKECKISTLKIKENDCGIYDALNKGIKLCPTEYYIVCGSDDHLNPNAISSVKKNIVESYYPDLVLSSMHLGTRPVTAFWGSKFTWLGADRIVAGHSVGMAIRKSLHAQLGYYRTDLSQAADAAFIYKLYSNQVSHCINNKFVGKFNTSGISNTGKLKQICETLQVQIESNCSPFLVFLTFTIRFFRFLRQLKK